MSTVAVTGLNATDNPAPGVAVARALKAADPATRVVGLAYDLLDPGNYALEWFDDVFLFPYPSQGTEAIEARLRYIHEKVPLDAVIPNLDSELPGFLALAPVLSSLGVGSFLPSREQLDLRSKQHLAELGERVGIPVPETVVLSDASELYTVHERVPYPFVVKGVFYGAKIVSALDEALLAYHDMLARWGGPVLVQRLVSGQEIDVAAVGDGDGGLVGAVAMRKTLLTDKGKGWAGIAVMDPALIETTRAFMAASRWQGPCEVEVMRDHEEKYQLLEINPRFPAWTYLSAGAGMNLPMAVVRLALGEKVAPMTEFKVGTMFVRISLDQIAQLEDFQVLTQSGELRGGPS